MKNQTQISTQSGQYHGSEDANKTMHIGERGSLIIDSTLRRKAVLNDIEK